MRLKMLRIYSIVLISYMATMHTGEIAFKNDVFRRGGFGVMMTQGIQAMGDDVRGILESVRNYSKFTPDNDPYGERDFGCLNWKGEQVFWKIDYYDQALQYGEDPMSPACKRVLTVMKADEY